MVIMLRWIAILNQWWARETSLFHQFIIMAGIILDGWFKGRTRGTCGNLLNTKTNPTYITAIPYSLGLTCVYCFGCVPLTIDALNRGADKNSHLLNPRSVTSRWAYFNWSVLWFRPWRSRWDSKQRRLITKALSELDNFFLKGSINRTNYSFCNIYPPSPRASWHRRGVGFLIAFWMSSM